MAPSISDSCYLRAAELGRRDCRQKRCEAGAREAPQAISCSIEIVLGGPCLSHRAGIGAKLEGEKGVKEIVGIEPKGPVDPLPPYIFLARQTYKRMSRAGSFGRKCISHVFVQLMLLEVANFSSNYRLTHTPFPPFFTVLWRPLRSGAI